MISRRGFLAAILAAGVAPALVRSSSLMLCRGILIPQYVYVYSFDQVGWSVDSTLGGTLFPSAPGGLNAIWCNGELLWRNESYLGPTLIEANENCWNLYEKESKVCLQ